MYASWRDTSVANCDLHITNPIAIVNTLDMSYLRTILRSSETMQILDEQSL